MFGVLVGLCFEFLFDISEYFTASIIFLTSGNVMFFVYFILMISFSLFKTSQSLEFAGWFFSAVSTKSFLLTVHVSCVVFATSSTHWECSASILMMSKPLAFETSKWVQYVGFNFYFPISYINFCRGFWGIKIKYVNVHFYSFSIFF